MPFPEKACDTIVVGSGIGGLNYVAARARRQNAGSAAAAGKGMHFEHLRVFRRRSPPLSRTGSDRAGELDVERQDEHHAHGLAHDDGLLAFLVRLLHPGPEPQFRNDPQKPPVSDQRPDGRSAEKSDRHRQLQRRRGGQVCEVRDDSRRGHQG